MPSSKKWSRGSPAVARLRAACAAQTRELRFDRLEMRLIEMDEEIKRLRSGLEFDRELGSGD